MGVQVPLPAPKSDEKDEDMQVTETLNEGLKRAYTITVTAAELDAKVKEKLVEALRKQLPRIIHGGYTANR